MKKLFYWFAKFFPQSLPPSLHIDTEISKEQYRLITKGIAVNITLCLMVEGKDVVVCAGELFPTNLTHQKLLMAELK